VDNILIDEFDLNTIILEANTNGGVWVTSLFDVDLSDNGSSAGTTFELRTAAGTDAFIEISGEVTAPNIVLAADGVMSLMAEKAGLRPEQDPKDFALGIKEVNAWRILEALMASDPEHMQTYGELEELPVRPLARAVLTLRLFVLTPLLLPFAVGDTPEARESEPNDSIEMSKDPSEGTGFPPMMKNLLFRRPHLSDDSSHQVVEILHLFCRVLRVSIDGHMVYHAAGF